MRTDRWLLAALLFLVGGLWLTFEWGHGSVGLNVAFPAEGTKLSINVFSVGWPVIGGLPLIAIGIVLMGIALVAAIVAQFHRSGLDDEDSITRLRIPSGD